MSALAGLDTTQPAPSVVFNLGMGVDSAAILLRYLTDPASRDFDLDDMVVITAMTGDEFASTGRDVENHILPLLRAHRVRYVQVARAQRLVTVAGDGVVVLDDSRSPQRVHLAGAFKLSDEMLQAGTIPQSGGARLCSVHAKGDALDPVIARITDGGHYRQIIGFEANEPKRAAKDATYNTERRTGVYPLIEWGWDREACIDFIASVTGGVIWEKSACSYCPFAMANKTSRIRVLARYADSPQAGVDTLFMEHVALTLNPAQGLVAGKRAIDMVRDAAAEQTGLTNVLDGLTAKLDTTEHAVYEVRRILRGRKDDPTKFANASRAISALALGSRADMLAELDDLAASLPVAETVTGDDGITRVYVRTRAADAHGNPVFPSVEQFYVVCPAVVNDKQDAKFDIWWDDLLTGRAAVASGTDSEKVPA